MIDWDRFSKFQQAVPVWQWCVLVVVVATAVWLTLLVRARFREDSDRTDESMKMLTQFRELHQEGGLSDDEFRLIRSRLARRANQAPVAGDARSDAVQKTDGFTESNEQQV